MRKKILEFFVNTKDGHIKTNADLANYEAHKFILLLQKVATFEEPEENIDSEDGIKDMIFCHQNQRSDTKPRELSKSLKMALIYLTHLKNYIIHYFKKKKMAKTKGGLNILARPRRDYFENRRFAVQKEIR